MAPVCLGEPQRPSSFWVNVVAPLLIAAIITVSFSQFESTFYLRHLLPKSRRVLACILLSNHQVAEYTHCLLVSPYPY